MILVNLLLRLLCTGNTIYIIKLEVKRCAFGRENILFGQVVESILFIQTIGSIVLLGVIKFTRRALFFVMSICNDLLGGNNS